VKELAPADVHWLGMRLFVGIPLADAVTRELSDLVARLGSKDDGLRWTAPESWHITLQFLGNATTEQFECLKARLSDVCIAPVPVQLSELGCFDRAGVFFADVEVTPEMSALQQRVVAATSRCRLQVEARPFHPHITLARKTGQKRTRDQGTRKAGRHARAEKMGLEKIGLDRSLKKLVAGAGRPGFTPFTAREFVLYESHLGEGGSKYAAQMRVALDGT